ncbi:MAG: TrmB family transcriptional regulator [Spirochaetaceae bacterium]|nr:TrmB family transcriptional regulator [Spirochaetaceae bacterium]MBP5330011.1 TrmB family transcriptional regulator [Spirochaetaceae bacterium]
MSHILLTDNLISFGLTRQEAQIYLELLTHGEMSGYEAAKETGISRSNAYSSLSGLIEKGAARLIEGETTKYTPVPLKEFLENALRELSDKADFLLKNAPKQLVSSDGYLTIKGSLNIKNKIRVMIEETKLRLYFQASPQIISEFETELRYLVEADKKVVILTDDYKLHGAKIYKAKTEEGQVRLITDSSYVLTGEMTGNEHDTCLYSGQQNLVSVMKEALKNKIVLLEKKQ